MVVKIKRNGTDFYLHTAWADDISGLNFNLEEYDEALFVGNYINRMAEECLDPLKYSWRANKNSDEEEDASTQQEPVMADIWASLQNNSGDIASTQQSTDEAIGNVNLLKNTNMGIANYATTAGYSIEEVKENVGEDTEIIRCIKITCINPSPSGMLFFDAEYLLEELTNSVDENTYTISMNTKMSRLFEIDTLAVQDPDGNNQQLVFETLSNDTEDENILMEDEWSYYNSTAQYTEVEKSKQVLCLSLANMPIGAMLTIANLKIEAGPVATPWRESVDFAIESVVIGGTNLIRNSHNLICEDYYFYEKILELIHDGIETVKISGVTFEHDGDSTVAIGDVIFDHDGNSTVLLT